MATPEGQVWSFSYTGAMQSFTIPDDVKRFRVSAAAGAGGKGVGGYGTTISGEYTKGTSSLSVWMYIGQRGGTPAGGSTSGGYAGWPDGGKGGTGYHGRGGGGGGGSTSVYIDGVKLFHIGGGGGGGGYNSRAGGNGGQPNGFDGANRGDKSGGVVVHTGGWGATQSYAGSGGVYPGGSYAPDGSGNTGGAGANKTSDLMSGGGGGGGGYYGGGGGGHGFLGTMDTFDTRYPGAGGGGGSSWYHPNLYNVSWGSNFGDGTVTITVLEINHSVTGVQLNPSAITLKNGQTSTLTATIIPSIADNKNLTWTNSNPSAISLTNIGASTANVTAVADGTSVITVTTQEGGFQASCTVTSYTPVSYINCKTETTIKVGQSETISTTVNSNATNKTLSWQSLDTSKATVNSSGVISAVGKGDVIVQVWSNSDPSVIVNILVHCYVAVISIDIPSTMEIWTANTAGINIPTTITPSNTNVTTINWSYDTRYIDVISNKLYPKALSVASQNTTLSVSITDYYGTHNDTCTVTVKQSVQGVTISGIPSGNTINKDASIQLQAVITPTWAFNPTVTWSSSDTSVASISSTGLVTGLKSGSTTIEVTTQDGGFTSSFVLNVYVAATGITLSPSVSIKILNRGDKYTFTPTITPTGTTYSNIVWTSGNPSIASVNSSTGEITGLLGGDVSITATVNDGEAKCVQYITVLVPITKLSWGAYSNQIQLGGTLPLQYVAEPLDYNQPITTIWTSSDTSIATVSNTGIVTPIKIGTFTITLSAKAKSQSNYVTIVSDIITVYQPKVDISAHVSVKSPYSRYKKLNMYSLPMNFSVRQINEICIRIYAMQHYTQEDDYYCYNIYTSFHVNTYGYFDSEWYANPRPHYQSYIQSIKDAFINKRFDWLNYGDTEGLLIGGSSINQEIYRALIAFDINKLQQDNNVEIVKAVLKLYTLAGSNPAQTGIVTNATQNWYEPIVVWKAQPTLGDMTVPYSFDKDASFVEIDITDIFNMWLEDTEQVQYKYGVELISDDETSGNFVRFSTREGDYPPELTVEYMPKKIYSYGLAEVNTHMKIWNYGNITIPMHVKTRLLGYNDISTSFKVYYISSLLMELAVRVNKLSDIYLGVMVRESRINDVNMHIKLRASSGIIIGFQIRAQGKSDVPMTVTVRQPAAYNMNTQFKLRYTNNICVKFHARANGKDDIAMSVTVRQPALNDMHTQFKLRYTNSINLAFTVRVKDKTDVRPFFQVRYTSGIQTHVKTRAIGQYDMDTYMTVMYNSKILTIFKVYYESSIGTTVGVRANGKLNVYTHFHVKVQKIISLPMSLHIRGISEIGINFNTRAIGKELIPMSFLLRQVNAIILTMLVKGCGSDDIGIGFRVNTTNPDIFISFQVGFSSQINTHIIVRENDDLNINMHFKVKIDNRLNVRTHFIARVHRNENVLTSVTVVKPVKGYAFII